MLSTWTSIWTNISHCVRVNKRPITSLLRLWVANTKCATIDVTYNALRWYWKQKRTTSDVQCTTTDAMRQRTAGSPSHLINACFVVDIEEFISSVAKHHRANSKHVKSYARESFRGRLLLTLQVFFLIFASNQLFPIMQRLVFIYSYTISFQLLLHM